MNGQYIQKETSFASVIKLKALREMSLRTVKLANSASSFKFSQQYDLENVKMCFL